MFYNFLNESTNLGINRIIGIEALIVCLLVFALTVVATRYILPVLRAKKLNQPINMYVKEHAGKAGTPTMGGICFIIASLLVVLVWVILEKCGVLGENVNRSLIPFALTLCLGVSNGLIGFIDDYKKLVKKEAFSRRIRISKGTRTPTVTEMAAERRMRSPHTTPAKILETKSSSLVAGSIKVKYPSSVKKLW